MTTEKNDRTEYSCMVLLVGKTVKVGNAIFCKELSYLCTSISAGPLLQNVAVLPKVQRHFDQASAQQKEISNELLRNLGKVHSKDDFVSARFI